MFGGIPTDQAAKYASKQAVEIILKAKVNLRIEA
jgi:hypothetical protein